MSAVSGSRKTELSVVIPVSERWDDLEELHEIVLQRLGGLGSLEVIFVLDGPNDRCAEQLARLRQKHDHVRVVMLNRWFGEATALSVGFDRSVGEIIVTLPAYHQVEPDQLSLVVEHLLKEDHDLVISRRDPRVDSAFNRWQGRVFHWLVRRLTGTLFRDISCGLRAMKRRVAEEIALYGDLHRFFPILAYERGFRVLEIPVRQSSRDTRRRIYRPGVYLRRILDILTLFFLFKFTKKPLRFFGLLGTSLGIVGAAITGYLGVYRLLGLGGISGRPLLVLGVLLLVMGLQLFSIGLLGEIIIFTHGKDRKDYTIDRMLR